MDKISQLPDELLVNVLLFLPTKVAISTSILSKRWEFLWMWLPKLQYYSESGCKRLADFINLNLPLHRAPVIEILRLKFGKKNIESITENITEDIRLWVLIAVSRGVCELRLNIYSYDSENGTKLPSSLYTCKPLVILELSHNFFVDVPRMACLPSLKRLILGCVTYADAKSLHQLLSSCPVLEDLVMEQGQSDHFVAFSVIVPSLQRLTLKISRGHYFDGFVIKTPSLKYFKVTDWVDNTDSDDDSDNDTDKDSFSFCYEDTPKLEEADIDSRYPNIDKFVRSITYVKRLSLCIQFNVEKGLYREGIVFNELQHLKLCSCDRNWSILLVRLLRDSPNLRELEVYLNKDHANSYPPVSLENQLDCVPGCLLSSLESFKWTGLSGSQEEIDLVKYILRNASCLKTAILFWSSSYPLKDKLEMMKLDLSLSFRRSKTCQLVFD